MNIYEALEEVLDNREFMAEYNRLWGTKLGVDSRVGIEKMVDRACGRADFEVLYPQEDLEKFFEFFIRWIWIPVVEREMDINT